MEMNILKKKVTFIVQESEIDKSFDYYDNLF